MLEVIDQLFGILNEAGFKISIQKCEFFQSSMSYLGFLISEEGKSPDPRKLEAVQEFPIPKTLKQIRQFYGLASYYRAYIRNFANIARPLTDIMKKGNRIIIALWGDRQSEAFDALKQLLASPPVLSHYKPGCQVIVAVDASIEGLGAILAQIQEGKEKPLEYASRKTSTVEAKLISNDLEAVAVHWAVHLKWRIYCLDGPIIVRTDNVTAATLGEGSNLNLRFQRLRSDLQQYEIAYETIKGSQNKGPDAFSRNPIAKQVNLLCIDASPIKLKELQTTDSFCRKVLKSLTDYPDKPTHYIVDKVTGVLMLMPTRNKLMRPTVILPEQLVPEVMKMCHDDLGHFNAQATQDRILARFWWPKCKAYIKAYVASCPVCKQFNRATTTPVGRYQSRKIPDQPLVQVSLDHKGPFNEAPDGYRYILVIVDSATKYLIAQPTRTTGVMEVTEILKKQILFTFGTPLEIISDRGTAFMSARFSQFCEKFGIKHFVSHAHHPEGNAVAERTIQTLIYRLNKVCNDDGTDWADRLQDCVFAINTATSRSLKSSPFRLVHAFDPVLPGEPLIATWIDSDQTEESRQESTEQLRIQSKETLEKSRAEALARRNKELPPSTFNVGDKVVYKFRVPVLGKPKSLIPRKLGVYYEIIAELSGDSYEIRQISGKGIGRTRTAHAHQLEKVPIAVDTPIPAEYPPVTTKSGREIKRPAHLKDFDE